MNKYMNLKNFFKLIIAIGVSELAGIIGSVFTTPSIAGWYAGVVKPALNPPAWVFGPVWTTLFALMGIAAFLVWKKGLDRRDVKIALGIFLGQLVLNTLWSIIFFGLHSPGGALIEIVFLWLAILATIIAFAKISKPAAWLLVPYILWVSFAGYLNYSIWQLNTSDSGQVACTQEAKLCPDGSYVGRTGPNCEFALCPENKILDEYQKEISKKIDLIRVDSPRPEEEIFSPLAISGEARGYWFFEASFPVVLVDWDGRIIAQGIATAQDEWMTENFVPFKAELIFEKPAFIGDFSKRGALILQKDNPSGLPKHNDALEIPISFKQ